MSDNHHRTVRITLDVVYRCGPLGFAASDKHRLITAACAGLSRAGVLEHVYRKPSDVLAADAVVIDRKADKEPTT
jgi:hypothetical protein